MTTEIYRSTFNRYIRGRLMTIAQALGVEYDVTEVNGYVKAYFPQLQGKRSAVTGCWVVFQPRLNRGPHATDKGVAITVRLPETVLTLDEASEQSQLLARLHPHLAGIEADYQNHCIKDD